MIEELDRDEDSRHASRLRQKQIDDDSPPIVYGIQKGYMQVQTEPREKEE